LQLLTFKIHAESDYFTQGHYQNTIIYVKP